MLKLYYDLQLYLKPFLPTCSPLHNYYKAKIVSMMVNEIAVEESKKGDKVGIKIDKDIPKVKSAQLYLIRQEYLSTSKDINIFNNCYPKVFDLTVYDIKVIY